MIASNSFCSPRSAAAEPMSHTCSTANRHAAERGQHEQRDLHAPHRHADVLRRVRVAADRENPVAEAGLREDERADRGEREPPEHALSECPARAACRCRAACTMPMWPSHMNRPLNATPWNKRIGEPVVRGDVADAGDDRAVGEHDRQRQREPAQDEQERQRDDERRQPRAHHEIAVQRAEQHRAGEREQDRKRRSASGSTSVGIATIMPAKPIMEPIDRSNSPAIISRHAPTASRPEIGGHLRPVHHAVEVEHARVAGAQSRTRGTPARCRRSRRIPGGSADAEPRFLAHAFIGTPRLRRWTSTLTPSVPEGGCLR